MELLRKLISALLFVFVVIPVSVVLIRGILDGGATSADSIGLGAAALAIFVIVYTLWNKDGFQRLVSKARENWGSDGKYEIPADIETSVSLMKYRRTGSFTVPMFRQRVKLWKGASFSVRSGHVSAPKDWVKEESGTLRLTASHLIYLGNRSNKKMTWRSIVSMSADKGILEVQQTNRNAVRWQGKGIDANFVAAAELLWRASEAVKATIAVTTE